MATRHTLVLPFTPATYPNPAAVLSTIYRTLVALPSSATHFDVHFSTPEAHGDQLYLQLLRSPEHHWHRFQTFLGKVYACLGAAQWTAGRVLLEVEVSFEGEDGATTRGEVIALKGYEDIAGSADRVIPHPPLDETVPAGSESSISTPAKAGPSVVALGGTFDHLHAAHKLLLHLALFLSTRKLIIGITADALLASKSHADLVESYDHRAGAVTDFLSRHNALRGLTPVELDPVRISDVYGPTGYDPDIDALVLSRETVAGGEAINKLRGEKGLRELNVFVIDVIASTLDGAEGAGPGGTAVEPVDPAGEEEVEREGRIHVRVGEEVRTLDLSGEADEKRLKELKMGSTAIRQWIADRQAD